MNTTYTTSNEAVNEIVTAIEAGAASRDEFDIDAIADEVIEQVVSETGQVTYQITATPDEFWTAVANHAL